ncbi:MAG: hypothetical protein KDD51_12710 [Bdellovibrionales bacterium]|nr:hypothetical protein [Bdellovibrionales bacterium]
MRYNLTIPFMFKHTLGYLLAVLLLGGCLLPGGKDWSSAANGSGTGILGPSGNGGGYVGGTMVTRPLPAEELAPGEFEMAVGEVLDLSPLLGYEVRQPASVFDDVGENFTLAFVVAANEQVDLRAASNSIIEKWDDYSTGYPFACRFHNQNSAFYGKISCHTHQKTQTTQTIGLNTATTLLDGQYHSIVYQRDGREFRLYHNGVLVDSKQGDFEDVSNQALFRLGHRLATASYPFFGRVSAIRLYTYPVDGATVAALGVADRDAVSNR